MSVVTNAILAIPTFFAEEWLLQEINKYLLEKHRQIFIIVTDKKLPPDWYGGGKRLEVFLAIAAFNYLDLFSLVKYIRRACVEYNSTTKFLFISREYPVQLIIREQDDDKFRIIDIYPEEERNS